MQQHTEANATCSSACEHHDVGASNEAAANAKTSSTQEPTQDAAARVQSAAAHHDVGAGDVAAANAETSSTREPTQDAAAHVRTMTLVPVMKQQPEPKTYGRWPNMKFLFAASKLSGRMTLWKLCTALLS